MGSGLAGYRVVGPEDPVGSVLADEGDHAAVVGLRQSEGALWPDQHFGLQGQRLSRQVFDFRERATLFVGIPLEGLRHGGLHQTHADGLRVGLALQATVTHDLPESPAHDEQGDHERESCLGGPVPAGFGAQTHAQEGATQRQAAPTNEEGNAVHPGDARQLNQG